MNIKILVAAHKQCEMPKSDVYLPVQVGKALHPDLDLGYQPDNEGENISEKNPYYSELTAIYWAESRLYRVGALPQIPRNETRKR